jgi:hypothetical protein
MPEPGPGNGILASKVYNVTVLIKNSSIQKVSNNKG